MKGFVLEWYPGYPDNESTGILACATAQELVDECARLVHMYGDQVKLTVKEVEVDLVPDTWATECRAHLKRMSEALTTITEQMEEFIDAEMDEYVHKLCLHAETLIEVPS